MKLLVGKWGNNGGKEKKLICYLTVSALDHWVSINLAGDLWEMVKNICLNYSILWQEVGVSIHQLPFVIGCRLLPRHYLRGVYGLL